MLVFDGCMFTFLAHEKFRGWSILSILILEEGLLDFFDFNHFCKRAVINCFGLFFFTDTRVILLLGLCLDQASVFEDASAILDFIVGVIETVLREIVC